MTIPFQVRSIAQVLIFDFGSKALIGFAGMLLIRFMPEGQFALLTFSAALIAIATQFFSASFNRIYLIGVKEPAEVSAGAFLMMEFAVLVLGALGGLPLQRFTRGLYPFVVAGVVTGCIADLVRTLYQRDLRFLHLSVFELAKSALFAATVTLLGVWRDGHLEASVVLAAQALVMLGVSVWPLMRRIGRRRPTWSAAVSLFRLSFGNPYVYLFGYFLLLAIFLQIDVIMLSVMAHPRDVAVYGAAFRYYSTFLLALNSAHVVLLPLLQSAAADAEVERIFMVHWRALGLFAVIGVAAEWAAGWVIPIIDGGKYPESVTVFRVLVVSAVISFALSPYANLFFVREEFRFLFVLLSGALPLSLALNFLLIPSYGAFGAAVATLISLGTVNLSIFMRSRRLRRKDDPVMESAKTRPFAGEVRS